MKTVKCPSCGAREVKGQLLHRKGCSSLHAIPAPGNEKRHLQRQRELIEAERLEREERESPAAVLGRLGGQARARNLSKAQLSEIGRNAIRKRWDRAKEVKDGTAH